MPSKFSNIFRKRTPTVPAEAIPVVSADPDRAPPEVSPPVDQAPVPKESTSPPPAQQSAGKLAPSKTFKNTILFASGIASNAGVPWVKMVTDSIIQVVRRLETMKLNEEASRGLDDDVKAFLYIVARNGGRNADDEKVEQFKRRIQSIRVEAPTTQNSVLRFLNAEETRDIITRLRQSLDSAVQLFQTGLQIALVDAMDEFKVWKAGIENSNSGSVIKKLLNQTYNAKGDLKVKTEASGTVSFTMQDSKFSEPILNPADGKAYILIKETEKNFTQHTRAANVTEILENSTVDADGDIEITTIATGIGFE